MHSPGSKGTEATGPAVSISASQRSKEDRAVSGPVMSGFSILGSPVAVEATTGGRTGTVPDAPLVRLSVGVRGTEVNPIVAVDQVKDVICTQKLLLGSTTSRITPLVLPVRRLG